MWKFECTGCGKTTTNKIATFVYSKNGCQCCLRNSKLDLFLKNKSLTRYGNIVDSRKPVELLCNLCGCIFSQTPHNITCKDIGCPGCLKIKQSKRTTERWKIFYASGKPLPASYGGIKGHQKGWIYGYFYQSSYEKNFIEYCHKNKIELIWQSLRIPYTFDGAKRIYIPDAIISNVIIEIKPYNVLHRLFDTSKYCPHEVLQVKISAAQQYAEANNMGFEIWTDKSHPWLKSGIIPSIVTS